MSGHPSSISKPVEAPKPAQESTMESRQFLQEGQHGTASLETSRSSRAYVVRPDGQLPRRPPNRGPLPESIIGTDDRKRIVDTDLAPWRMICALTIKGENATGIGTGWFVGPRTILTAGHCVFAPELGQKSWATSITVRPGLNGGEEQYKAVTATRFSAHKNWAEGKQDGDFDIGCIHLDEPLGATTGWFGFASYKPDELKDKLVNVSGYPMVPGFGKEQYFHADRVTSVSARRVFYEVDTYGGQSGSPVWVQLDASSPPVAVAIHAYGVSNGQMQNSAPRIDDEIYALINSWIAGDDASAPSV